LDRGACAARGRSRRRRDRAGTRGDRAGRRHRRGGLSRRGRRAARVRCTLHAPRLPGTLQRGRAQLGLPLPRVSLRRRRRSAERAGSACAQARPRGLSLEACGAGGTPAVAVCVPVRQNERGCWLADLDRMRVLLLGATGLVGAAVLARLTQTAGHEVTAVARRRGAALRHVRWLELDIASATSPDDWLEALSGIEVVVNCAGALSDGGRDRLHGVHVDGVAALARACERAGVRRFVHISAVGADRDPITPFSATKQAGEQALAATSLDWVILRPAVVVGRAAFGGSALIRGLAGLPVPVALDG